MTILARCAACAAAAVLAASAPADLIVAVQSGDRVTGTLDPGFEEEVHRIFVPAGATVTFKASCSRKAGPLEAVLRGEGGETARTGTKLVVPYTAAVEERVEFAVRQDPQNGPLPYKLSVSIRYAPVAPVTGDAPTLAVSVLPQTRARFAVKRAPGSDAEPAITEVTNPDGAPLPITPGPRATVRCEQFGTYVASASGGGPSVLSCALKGPKEKRKLGLRPGDVQEDVTDVVAGFVTPAGGDVVALEGTEIEGARIDAPSGALPSAKTLLVGRAPDVDLPEAFAGVAGGPAVFFGPEGTQFKADVTITIPFDTSLIGALDPIRVFRRDADGSVTEITGFTVDLVAGTVSLPTDHFSVYQVFRAAPLPVQGFLTPSGVSVDGFGRSVDVDGNLAVVGAPGRSVAMQDGAGGVVVFERTGVSWVVDETIDNPAPGSSDLAGVAVAVDAGAELVVVGAPYAGGANDGRVFVYRRTGGNWNLEQTLSDAAPSSLQAFGSQVAVSDDTIAVATPFNTLGGGNNGSVFVYWDTGTWTLEQQIDAVALPHLFGSFGTSLSLDGDRLLIGDPHADNGAATDTGAVYVFKRDTGAWSLEHTISGEEFAAGSEFGHAVAEKDGVAVVGIPSEGAGGAAALFTRDAMGTGWTKVQLLTGPTTGGDFGKGVGFDDGIAAIGEPGFDAVSGAPRGGRVHLYRWDGVPPLRTVLRRLAPNGAQNGEYGNAVAVSGLDVLLGWNGDSAAPALGQAEFLELTVLGGL
ncbi:MAG: hypothetical protein HMLKMBBP_02623 [Planctomycetes bacterium]|nr:hypothetical protein [Planctomycetota bacterium]